MIEIVLLIIEGLLITGLAHSVYKDMCSVTFGDYENRIMGFWLLIIVVVFLGFPVFGTIAIAFPIIWCFMIIFLSFKGII